MQALVKTSRRVWFIVSAVIATGTIGYASINAVVKTDRTIERVEVLERHDWAFLGMARKMDIKLDMALKENGVDVPANLRAPSDAEWNRLVNDVMGNADEP